MGSREEGKTSFSANINKDVVNNTGVIQEERKEPVEPEHEIIPPPEEILKPKRMLIKYLDGFMVGMINASIFQPIDVVRTRYFLHTKGIGTVFSLMNGIRWNLISTGLKQMAVYPTQDLLTQSLKSGLTGSQVNEHVAEFLGGIIAGMFLGFVASPLNAIKVPLQANTQNPLNRTLRPLTEFQVIKSIHEQYGITGFWRGGLATVLRDTLWSAVYFPAHKWLKKNIFIHESDPNPNPNPYAIQFKNVHFQNFMCAITASLSALFLSYPFDGSRLWRQHVVRQKIVNGVETSVRQKVNYTFWYGFVQSLKPNAENFKSLTAGAIRVPLSTAVCHGLYLGLQRYREDGRIL
eukprot:TRINITY_DN6472_c0_g1_i1.p1 TRINITY_DN6472_c0_g1~~TRINITY_DN6472_c0_g1_i1.p1  ORF type:complete len:357 (-),score=71.83 TRINITY_DN6472_c0_g1_i1:53-1099(-)